MLQILHLSEQHTCIAHNRATRLEQNSDLLALIFFGTPAINPCKQSRQIICYGNRLFIVVGNADATADIKMMQSDTGLAKSINEFDDFVERFEQRRIVEQLRPDMAVDADDVQMR